MYKLNGTALTLRVAILFCAVAAPIHQGLSTAGSARSQKSVGPATFKTESRMQNSSQHISGQLSDAGGPITDAAVYLNHLKDRACVRLFESRRKPSEKTLRRIRACVTDKGPIRPDTQGRYVFTDLSPGYYALVVSWHTKEAFKKPVLAFRKGEYVVSYFKGASYNIVATSKVFYFSGAEDMVKDFDFARGRITDEIVPD